LLKQFYLVFIFNVFLLLLLLLYLLEPDSIYIDIKNKLVGLDIAVLFNNVGIMPMPEYFHTKFSNDIESINSYINVNIIALTKMTQIIVPSMIEKRNGGIIINNCSCLGRISAPLFTIYSATKAYVDFFSRFLSYFIE
jgi:17beta-estradiol 17-dehydrogenase / very-long-chain 3-oxoacyl-CoA reductase